MKKALFILISTFLLQGCGQYNESKNNSIQDTELSDETEKIIDEKSSGNSSQGASEVIDSPGESFDDSEVTEFISNTSESSSSDSSLSDDVDMVVSESDIDNATTILSPESFGNILKNFDSNNLKILIEGDSVSDIKNGELISIDGDNRICISHRNHLNQINFDCVKDLKEKIEKIKMPCIYEDKFYPHGSIIPVSPGEWIYYRGEVFATRPGIMLVCDDGKLVSHEIRER